MMVSTPAQVLDGVSPGGGPGSRSACRRHARPSHRGHIKGRVSNEFNTRHEARDLRPVAPSMGGTHRGRGLPPRRHRGLHPGPDLQLRRPHVREPPLRGHAARHLRGVDPAQPGPPGVRCRRSGHGAYAGLGPPLPDRRRHHLRGAVAVRSGDRSAQLGQLRPGELRRQLAALRARGAHDRSRRRTRPPDHAARHQR